MKMQSSASSPPPPPPPFKARFASPPSWFASDPSKAYYEKFSLIWAPLSMFVLLVGVFGTPLYKSCDRNSYLAITVLGCLPGILIPLLYPCQADRSRPFTQRFWVKGTVWIAIFGFYGNYFWTHYFYHLLGAQYLFDSYRLNDVPLVTFTATFFYFTFYFNLVSLLLRRLHHHTRDLPPISRSLLRAANILALAYATAVFEAVSIQHFPLYTYPNPRAFLLVGSVVYALYFVVGFPLFFALDEHPRRSALGTHPLSLRAVACNALAAVALITLLLDLWRLFLGSIDNLGAGAHVPLPFVYQRGQPTCGPAAASVSDSARYMTARGEGVCRQAVHGCANEAAAWVGGVWQGVRKGMQHAVTSAGMPPR